MPTSPFDGVTPLRLGLDSNETDVREYEKYAAIAILRLQAARRFPHQLQRTATVRDVAGKIQRGTLTARNYLAVEVTYRGPSKGLLVALTDHGVVIDLSACTYHVPNPGEDIDYEVEGHTVPRHVFIDEIAEVRQIVDSVALQAALE